MMITKEQVDIVKKFFGGIDLENLSPELIDALSALIAVGEKLAEGSHVLVSKSDSEKIWVPENFNDLPKDAQKAWGVQFTTWHMFRGALMDV